MFRHMNSLAHLNIPPDSLLLLLSEWLIVASNRGKTFRGHFWAGLDRVHRRRRAANAKQQPQHQDGAGQCANDREREEGKDLLDTKSYRTTKSMTRQLSKKLSRHITPWQNTHHFLIAFTRAECSSVAGGPFFLRFVERREESNILCLHTSVVFCTWLPREQTERGK